MSSAVPTPISIHNPYAASKLWSGQSPPASTTYPSSPGISSMSPASRSVSGPLLPNGDNIELQKWNEWLTGRYPNRNALAAAWNVLPSTTKNIIPLPEEIEFTPRGMYVGHNSLKVYDYSLFAQESFAAWVKSMHDKIRAAGSKQLITVGQDEGGYVNRLSPAFFGPSV